MSIRMKKIETGLRIPILGFATRTLSSDSALVALKTAIDSGCRHIDCSSHNHNEADIGIALERIFQEGDVKRSEIFITGKYTPASISSESVRETLQKSLKQLRVDYLDLYLLQDPNAVTAKTLLQKSESIRGTKRANFPEVWKELEIMQKEGLTRNIGLAEFKEYHIESILSQCSIPPALHQVNSKSLDDSHIDFCQKKGIAVAAYLPLRQRALTTRSSDTDRAAVKEIAARYGKTTTQVTIRAHIERGLISVIESAKPAQIRSKFQVLDFELDASEVAKVLALDKKQRSASSTEGQEFRLIDIIDEKPTKHHRRWGERGRVYSEASDDH